MDKHAIERIVEEVVHQLTTKTDADKHGVPIGVSARHVHLKKEDVEQLFGKGYELTKKADLSQPGQFAANETVTLVGPKGAIQRVRILGPSRNISQVEVSKTDAFQLGLNPPLRESGNITGSAPITIVGPKGSIYLSEGLIVAQAHIHMTPEDADYYDVKNGDIVQVKSEGERAILFDNILIRVSERYKLEMHIDTDEANAGLIKTGHTGTLIKYGDA